LTVGSCGRISDDDDSTLVSIASSAQPFGLNFPSWRTFARSDSPKKVSVTQLYIFWIKKRSKGLEQQHTIRLPKNENNNNNSNSNSNNKNTIEETTLPTAEILTI
jgi:hypothetical protein